MLEGLRQLFHSRVAIAEDASPEANEQALRVAAAALMFEIVRADANVSPEELVVMRASLQSTFDLSADETEELVRLAEQQSKSAASLYEFTSLVDARLDVAQKKRIVELLWLVAFADGRKDALEEHLVRRIAGLLHVSHPDFIDAKLRARARSAPDQDRG
jgi:uncharacterized tellurite resistance protein B-like protein